MDDNGSLDAFMDKAAHVIGSIFDMMEDLGRIAGSVISILFGTDLGSTDAWDNFADILDRVADFLANPDNQAKISEFVNDFGGFAFMVGTFLSKMDEIPGRVRSVIAWFQALPQKVGSAMSSLPSVLGHWASVAINQLGYYIGYGIGWVVKQFWNLPGNTLRAIAALPRVFGYIGSWLLGALNWLPGAMYSVGRNIVAGIWNGIVSLSNWLWNAAYNFAASIWKGIKSALGISSPSTVMADEVGRWIPAGIAMGMDRNRGAVTDAIDRISDDLAASSLAVPTVGMDAAMAAAAGTLTVGARRQAFTVRQVLDVTGQEGKLKTLIRGMARTENLYQTGSAT
jgi:phage-related protein